MSLQWTLVAGFLYLEIAIVFLLVLPFISAKRWQAMFRSRFLIVLSNQAQWYFGVLVFILILFLLDAIREMRKYSNKELHDHQHHLESELQMSMRLFRSQRNFYISGFSLFLSIVIRRLVSLISTQAALMAENTAALSQAKSASTVAHTLMRNAAAGETAENSSNEATALQEENTKLQAQLSLLEDELDKAKKDKQAIIEQSKGVEHEYDRLMEEHRKLQLKISVQPDAKKDE